MTTTEFIDKAIEYVNVATEFKYESQIVWFNYILGNMKALLITISPDSYYYEVTYNRSKNEIYVDKYTKVEKKVITL